jgi:glutamine amidotransferase
VSDVVIVDYGAGNTRSVRATLHRLGITTVVTNNPLSIYDAHQVILPGVGSARSAMAVLRESGAADALRRRFKNEKFTLGICLGMQLALEHTDEDDGVATLGLIEGHVRRVEGCMVPRLGWSLVEPWNEAFYFAHSFEAISPHTTATAEGVAAVCEYGSFTGVQFHPEKSGLVGERWLAACLSAA